jgi:hypothetical protein
VKEQSAMVNIDNEERAKKLLEETNASGSDKTKTVKTKKEDRKA